MYRLATLATALFIIALPALAQQARFEELGDLPGGEKQTWVMPRSISADGATIVGRAHGENGYEAFRWQGGELEGLGYPDGAESQSLAQSVSANGSLVVGFAVGSDAIPKAFRWENSEIELISTERSNARGISSDGSTIVGHSGGYEAVRWVDGTMEGLGYLPGHTTSSAWAISSDGSTIVGWSNTGGSEHAAFRWTEEEGMVSLGRFGGDVAEASAVNADGSVVVGISIFPPFERITWRWEDGMMEELPDLPNADLILPQAHDVSGDGSIVVGVGHVETPEGTAMQRPIIWTEEEDGWQARDLQEVLENDYGLDLTGWTLTAALGISDDGNVIIGNAISPDAQNEGIVDAAWRAEAPFGQPVADEATPEALADVLTAPSPNPASGTSTFTIAVKQGQNVSVEVFDALGRQVQTVYEGVLAAGMSERLTLDASALPAGVYIIRATGEDFVKSRRVTVVR